MEMEISPTFSSMLVDLRPLTADDFPTLLTYLNHQELTGRRYIPWGFPNEVPLSQKQVEGILSKWGEKEKGFVLGIVDQEKGGLIGHVETSWGWDPHNPDLSILIAPAHQRQGFGSETLRLVLTFLFEHTPAHNVAGGFSDWNETARHFATKHGFKESGFIRRDGIRKGAFYDTVIVDLLRPEWKAMQGG
jgi:RimJ/RimL family protein N-acetyltransferase